MMAATKEQILKAKKKAVSNYNKGIRYYDDKHKTYHNASMSENVLEQVSDLLGFYGIEAFDPKEDNSSRPKYSYVNSGDSYNLTLIYNNDSSRFLIACIGSIIESEG